MQKTKCHQCGLVNWQGATACARCKASLSGTYSTGLNPFENESNSGSSFSVMKVGLIAVVLAVLGFAAYQFTKPDPPKAAATDRPIVLDSSQVQKAIQESQKDQFERDAQIQKQVQQGLESLKTDPNRFKLSDEQIRQNLKQFQQNGVHFGPGSVPPR